MKCRVVSENHTHYNVIFDVRFLSYNLVKGLDKNTYNKIDVGFEDVEFICDATWEEELIKCRDVLNITKPEEASYYFYYAVLKSLEAHLGSAIENMVVIRENDLASKKVWIKKVEACVNGRPVVIEVTGKKKSNNFDIQVTDIDKELFKQDCERELEKLKIGLKDYTKRINGLMYTMYMMDNKNMYTSTLELKEAQA
jgi:hypothetical protein